MGPKRKIPDRWEEYTKIGSTVEGTNIVAFKVPLKCNLTADLSEEDRWGIEDLLASRPDLGTVVDLTFTSRYYNSNQLKTKGVDYVKIFTRGHEIPSPSVYAQFTEAVRIHNEARTGQLLGVHCTHGLNRTGYLVCRYMIQELGITPQAAIQAFDEARGHKQERENYVNHLSSKGWESEEQEVDQWQTEGEHRHRRASGNRGKKQYKPRSSRAGGGEGWTADRHSGRQRPHEERQNADWKHNHHQLEPRYSGSRHHSYQDCQWYQPHSGAGQYHHSASFHRNQSDSWRGRGGGGKSRSRGRGSGSGYYRDSGSGYYRDSSYGYYRDSSYGYYRGSGSGYYEDSGSGYYRGKRDYSSHRRGGGGWEKQ